MESQLPETDPVTSVRAFAQAQLFIERGGPAYRLMQRIGLIKGQGPSVGRRIVAFLALTWLPVLVLALTEGRFLGPTPRESFLLDFTAHARFFVAVPVLIIAEVMVGPRLTGAGLHFLTAGLIRSEELSSYRTAIERLVWRRDSLRAELLILSVAMLGAWVMTTEQFVWRQSSATWQVIGTGDSARLSWAGLWYKLIAVPLLQFLYYRWLWRLFIWGAFLFRLSRLKLYVVGTHADAAAGLGFLGTAHCSLSIFGLGFGAVLSAEAAFQIIYEAAAMEAFFLVFGIFVVIVELLVFGMLLCFAPMLIRVRREGLRSYSALVDRHNQAFHDKWVAPKAGETPLGSQDVSSLIDLGSSFQMLQATRPVPFSRRQIIGVALIAAIPVVPLVFLLLPVSDVLRFIFKALL